MAVNRANSTIQIKPKKCRGTGKALGHGCGSMQLKRKLGLGYKCGCFQKWARTTPEGIEFIKKSVLKGKKILETENKKKQKQEKEASKTISTLIKETRTPFQKIIRIRDHDKKCICCDRNLPFYIGDYDAGHMFKAETNSCLIFHPLNVNGQTVYCNKYSHGNESGYIKGFIERYGEEKYKELLDYKEKHKNHRWERAELINMKKHYLKELRLLEKGQKIIEDIDLSIGIL